MNKAKITEEALLDAINLALENDWEHPNCHCRVEKLRQANRTSGNWEVDSVNYGGETLEHHSECDELRKRVLDELYPKYDVAWP